MIQPQKAKTGFLFAGSVLVPVAALFVFRWLAREVFEGDTQQFDSSLRNAIHTLASPALTKVMEAFSFIGSVAVLVGLTVLVILLLLYFHRARAAALLAVTMAGSFVLDVALKLVFQRTRPDPFFVASPSSYSFPSGHALNSLCFYGALAAILSARLPGRGAQVAIWTFAALLVCIIGVSRVYLGVHYPSDVIAGFCVAIVWVGGVSLSDQLLRRRS